MYLPLCNAIIYWCIITLRKTRTWKIYFFIFPAFYVEYLFPKRLNFQFTCRFQKLISRDSPLVLSQWDICKYRSFFKTEDWAIWSHTCRHIMMNELHISQSKCLWFPSDYIQLSSLLPFLLIYYLLEIYHDISTIIYCILWIITIN